MFLVVALPRGINEIIENKSYKAGDERSGGVFPGVFRVHVKPYSFTAAKEQDFIT